MVSWQAPNTLGWRLANHASEVPIFGAGYRARAQVAAINGFSGHAGRDLLIQWAKALLLRVKKVFLVHGDPDALAALKHGLEAEGLPGVYAPEFHETVEV